MRTRAIPERFCGGDSQRRGAISSVCTFTFTFLPNQTTYESYGKLGVKIRVRECLGFVIVLRIIQVVIRRTVLRLTLAKYFSFAYLLSGRSQEFDLGVYVLTSHCNFKTYVTIPHVNIISNLSWVTKEQPHKFFKVD